MRGFREGDLPEERFFHVLDEDPVLGPTSVRPNSIYPGEEGEVYLSPQLCEVTYHFESITGWREVGLQILGTTGWRPDSSTSCPLNLARLLRPEIREGRHFIVGGLEEAMRSEQREA